MSKVLGQIDLTIRIEEDEGLFAAECVELGTVSCGDTYEEAAQNIYEAICVHLEGLDKNGHTARVFRERGIEVRPVIHPEGSQEDIELLMSVAVPA